MEQQRTNRVRLATVAVALVTLTGLGGMQMAAAYGLDASRTSSLTAEGPLEASVDEGRWLQPFDSEIPAVNLAVTPDGQVVYYDGAEANASHSHSEDAGPHAHPQDATFFTTDPEASESRIFDPRDGSITEPGANPPVDLFCSGTTVRPDGSVMSVGGSYWPSLNDPDEPGLPILDNPEVKGTDEVYTLDPQDDVWSDEADLTVRRWYPTVVETADGGAFAASGIKNLSEARTHNAYFDRLHPGEDTWDRVAPSFQIAEGVSVDHQGRVGNTELSPAPLPLYPKLFVVPSGPHKGEILYPASGDMWAPFGERPDEALWGTFQFIDPDTGEVTFNGASPFGPRNLGNAVPLMLDASDGYDLDILSLGGTLERTGAATNTAEIIDIDGDTVESEPTDAMEHPRWHPNSILLPTGDVVTVGGSYIDDVLVYGQDKVPVFQAELFDASEEEFRPLASMELPRDYHSTAALLPSGEVLVGGHVPLPAPPRDVRQNIPGQDQRNITQFEIFQPPYLINDEDTRPDIIRVDGEPADEAQEEAVAAIDFDREFSVTVKGADEGIASVTLLRPGAVTHTIDADQRGIRLDVKDVQPAGEGKKITLQAPPDGAVAPPGHYMLFVNEQLEDEVYPSRAEFVAIGPEDLVG